MPRDFDEKITVTMTRQQWFDITGALGHDIFDGNYNEEYDIIWNAAFPKIEDD